MIEKNPKKRIVQRLLTFTSLDSTDFLSHAPSLNIVKPFLLSTRTTLILAPIVIFSKKLKKVLSLTVFKEQFYNKTLDRGLKVIGLINWKERYGLLGKGKRNK